MDLIKYQLETLKIPEEQKAKMLEIAEEIDKFEDSEETQDTAQNCSYCVNYDDRDGYCKAIRRWITKSLSIELGENCDLYEEKDNYV